MFGRATIRLGIGPHSSYSFIAADTLCDLVTLTFDLLTLVRGHTWRVTWSTKFEDPTAIRS